MDLLLLWIIIAAALAVTELLTMALIAMYFAIGAAAAALVAWLDGHVALQLVAFAATGIVLLLISRPILKGRLESPTVHTNVDRMVGKRGIVTIPIDNDANTGQIRVGTEYWTARWVEDATAAPIPVDTRVEIVAVDGVTARVRVPLPPAGAAT